MVGSWLPFLLFALVAQDMGESAAPPTVLVEIHGELQPAAQTRLVRAIREAKSRPGAALVVSIDTPGGEVTLMGEMGDALDRAQSDGSGLEIVAMISGGPFGGAFSAGSFLALACGRIYMAPGTSIGAALPVVATPFGLAAADALGEGKLVESLSARFRALAEKRGRDGRIAAAFVDPDLGLRLVRVEQGGLPVVRTTQELEDLRMAGGSYETIREIKSAEAQRPLALTASEAFELHLSSGVVNDLPDLLRTMGRDSSALVKIEASAGEDLIALLLKATPLLLFLGIVLGALEAKIPGFGIAGILSTLCFALVFYGRYLLGVAEFLEILLFAAGLLLIAAEIFFLQGTIYPAVLGVMCIAVSLVLSFQNFLFPRDAIDSGILLHNLSWGAGAAVAALVAIVLLSPLLPKSPLFRATMLPAPEGVEGSGAGARTEVALVGRTFLAETDLRPAGRIDVDGRPVDAVTRGEFVERGARVFVMEVTGNRVVVRPEAPAA